MYPAVDKLGKQFNIADQKKIPYVALIGESERATGSVTLKNMQTGDQETIAFDLVSSRLTQNV